MNSVVNIQRLVIVTDDVRMGAAISSKFIERGGYVTVLEGPRLRRPDYTNEVIRLVNIINRISPTMIMYAKQPTRASKLVNTYLNIPFVHINNPKDLDKLEINYEPWKDGELEGIAKILHTTHHSPSKEKLAVLCDNNKDIVSVIAANYAIAHGADYFPIATPDKFSEEVIERLNDISSIGDHAIRRIDVGSLSEEIRAFIPQEILDNQYDKILFVTDGVPYSLALPDRVVVCSDIINFGQNIAHNLFDHLWSRSVKGGVTGLFVANTSMSTDREDELVAEALLKAKGFSKTVYGKDTRITEWEITTLPYDFLYIATHGNQIQGVENTYSITGQDKQTHLVVTKEGIGSASRVVFIESIDGHVRGSSDWSVRDANIWGWFIKKHIMTKKMPDPTSSTSTSLRMRQLFLGDDKEPGMMSPVSFDRLASAQRPLVMVSACGSWTDLSRRFMYAGATAYIGTLWPITDSTAIKFAEAFFPKLFDMDLLDAFTQSKQSLANDLDRLTYAISGSFESMHDPGASYSTNAYDTIMGRLKNNLAKTRQTIKENETSKTPQDIVEGTLRDELYYTKEIEALERAYKEANKD